MITESTTYTYYYQFRVSRNKVIDCTIASTPSEARAKLRAKWGQIGEVTNFDLLEGDEIPAHLDELANQLQP